ncbi:hypothetical protein, partial [Peribacillus deserti]|uniref:hypothetical protein n=1 Tax=Peribacillus deserti TaxID=673318 RepID=UPI001C60CEBA
MIPEYTSAGISRRGIWLLTKAVFANFVVIEQVVDWNVRMLAFRGAGAEPPRLRLWGLTCPAAPAGVSHLTFQST